MKAIQEPTQRKMGVNVSLDLATLQTIDRLAAEAGLTRSAWLRQMVVERVEEETEDRALLAQAEAILADPGTTWKSLEEVEAGLGL
jgi:hypothetical protein